MLRHIGNHKLRISLQGYYWSLSLHRTWSIVTQSSLFRCTSVSMIGDHRWSPRNAPIGQYLSETTTTVCDDPLRRPIHTPVFSFCDQQWWSKYWTLEWCSDTGCWSPAAKYTYRTNLKWWVSIRNLFICLDCSTNAKFYFSLIAHQSNIWDNDWMDLFWVRAPIRLHIVPSYG